MATRLVILIRCDRCPDSVTFDVGGPYITKARQLAETAGWGVYRLPQKAALQIDLCPDCLNAQRAKDGKRRRTVTHRRQWGTRMTPQDHWNIWEFVTRNPGATISEVAEGCGLARSTAYRFVSAMTKVGTLAAEYGKIRTLRATVPLIIVRSK